MPSSTTQQIAPLLYDTIVTAMTVVKAVTIRRRSGGASSRLIQTFLREGRAYRRPIIPSYPLTHDSPRCLLLYSHLGRQPRKCS